MAKETISYPHHMRVLGPVAITSFEAPVKSLGGAYLHYAYLVAKNDGRARVLEFLPSGFLRAIQFGYVGDLEDYSPSEGEALMQEVVTREMGDVISNLPKLVFGATNNT